MKFILLYLLIISQTFGQNNFLDISTNSVPPFKVGNKWLFNVEEYDNGISINYKMTKEIVDTVSANRFVINTKKYFENQIVDSTEYWTWQDSAYSQSQYPNETGEILYKIGQEDYYISQYPNIWYYTNIVDTIFNIISEGAEYSYTFHMNLFSSTWGTKVALKIGPYEYHLYSQGDGNYNITTENLIGVRINNNILGDTSYLVTSIYESNSIVNDFSLFQNYPNPFNPSTLIKYSIPNECFVKLKVFDLLGNQVTTLVSSEKSAGTHIVEFNSGSLSSGIYFYRLESKGKFITKKMLLIK